MGTSEETRRFNCDVAAEDFEQLEALMTDLGLRSKRQLFEEAVGLLRWAVNERKAGQLVGSMNDRRMHFRELTTPALQRVRKD